MKNIRYYKYVIDINICIDEDRRKYFIIFIYLYEISIINFFFCFGSLLFGLFRIFLLLF